MLWRKTTRGGGEGVLWMKRWKEGYNLKMGGQGRVYRKVSFEQRLEGVRVWALQKLEEQFMGKKEQQYNRSWGWNVPGMFQVQQKGRCGQESGECEARARKGKGGPKPWKSLQRLEHSLLWEGIHWRIFSSWGIYFNLCFNRITWLLCEEELIGNMKTTRDAG